MAREAPGLLDKFLGLFFVGGDPDQIRQAAGACRALAGHLTSRSEMLDRTAAQVLASWTKGNGRDAYQTTAKSLGNDLREYSGDLTEGAKTLDGQADEIADAQRQARNFAIMAAATVAAGAALSIVSFGTSAAAAAGELAIIKAGFFTMMWRVALALAARGLLMAAIRAALLTVAKRMLIGMAASWIATAVVKAIQGQNLLDPASWSANDASNILLGGVLTAGLIQAPIGVVKSGVIGGTTGGALSQFWLNDKPLNDPLAWVTVGVSGLLAGTVGSRLGVLGDRLSPAAARLAERMPFIKTGPPPRAITMPSLVKQQFGPKGPGKFTINDKVKTGTGLPVGVAFYGLNFTGILGAIEEPPGDLRLPESPAPIDLPTLGPSPEQRRQAQTRTVTVRQYGDSLYAIAERMYGDGSKFGLIAEANGIGPPYTIFRGQVLTIPPAVVPVGVPG